MAYTGAVSMCSSEMIIPSGYYGIIILIFSIIILASILLNNKGQRTWVAALLVSVGIILLLMSQYFALPSVIFYFASFLLFFGIWVNGSFLSFYKKYFNKKIKSSIQPKI